MGNETTLPALIWSIPCFDRTLENPHPVHRRCYRLDWARLTDIEQREVLHLVSMREQQQSRHKPVGFDETIITMSVGEERNDSWVFGYRHYFVRIPNDDVQAFHSDGLQNLRAFMWIRVSHEYCEDENGMPISLYERFQHVSGQEFPIILDHAESVVRLGAVSAVNRDQWSLEKANTIAQFLDVVERIHASVWYHTPRSITSVTRASGEPKLLEARFANDTETMAVLAYFRQLHAGDKLLVKACEAYESHTGDGRKRLWVKDQRTRFQLLVDSPPFPFDKSGKSRREIVRMFMYGARLLHSSSNQGDDVALSSFIDLHGQHTAVMIFNSSLVEFFRVAATLYPVIRQDYIHWIQNDGIVSASRVAIPDLFREFISPPHGSH